MKKPEYTGRGITSAEYNKFTELTWKKVEVRNLNPIQTRAMIIPVDTVLTIVEKFGGFTVEGPACECCKVAIRASRVNPNALIVNRNDHE